MDDESSTVSSVLTDLLGRQLERTVPRIEEQFSVGAELIDEVVGAWAEVQKDPDVKAAIGSDADEAFEKIKAASETLQLAYDATQLQKRVFTSLMTRVSNAAEDELKTANFEQWAKEAQQRHEQDPAYRQWKANARRARQQNLQRTFQRLTQEDTLEPDEDMAEDENMRVMDDEEDTEETLRCPLTAQLLENPVRAPCSHVMSRDAAFNYLAGGVSGRMPCPVAGCGRHFTREQLQSDGAVQARLNKFRRQRLYKREPALEGDYDLTQANSMSVPMDDED
ncbi:MAG: hypothetical protein MHM6MM_002587 [Cercozoa sp. M6MM]